MSRRPLPAWGLLAIAFYLVHAGYHVLHHQPEHVFWSCHLATMLVGAGFLVGSATLNGIAFLWLLVGDTIWFIDLHNGGEFIPTSVLPHFGGLALSVFGLKRLGMPRSLWWKAVFGLMILQEVTRHVTPPASNVNLAFTVWAGWEHVFPSYLGFEVMLFVSMLSIFFVAETITRRILASRFEGATTLRWDRAA